MENERFKIWISFAKYTISIILGTILTAYLGFIINQRELDLQEIQQKSEFRITEQENLSRYFKYTLEGNAYDRLKLSTFFSIVIEDSASRNRWSKYNQILEKQLTEYTKVQILLDSLERVIVLKNDSSLINSKEYRVLEERKKRLTEILNPIELFKKIPSELNFPKIDFDDNDSELWTDLYLERFHFSNGSIIGRLYSDSNRRKLISYTLENYEKRIPMGEYTLQFSKQKTSLTEIYQRRYPYFDYFPMVSSVPNYSSVYFLVGSSADNSGAAILLGNEIHTKDGHNRIQNSNVTYKNFYLKLSENLKNNNSISITIVETF